MQHGSSHWAGTTCRGLARRIGGDWTGSDSRVGAYRNGWCWEDSSRWHGGTCLSQSRLVAMTRFVRSRVGVACRISMARSGQGRRIGRGRREGVCRSPSRWLGAEWLELARRVGLVGPGSAGSGKGCQGLSHWGGTTRCGKDRRIGGARSAQVRHVALERRVSHQHGQSHRRALVHPKKERERSEFPQSLKV